MKYIFVLFPILFYNFIFSNIAICNEKLNKNKNIITINNKPSKISNDNTITNRQFSILKTNDYKDVKLKKTINLNNYSICDNNNKNKNENLLLNNKTQYQNKNSMCDYYKKPASIGRKFINGKKKITPSSQFCRLEYSQRIGYFCNCK